jgi:chromosome partitioning protein
MRTIMVINAKGGSGKSTIATNLASYYASTANKVSLVDYDPQGSSMAWLKARPINKPKIQGIDATRTTVNPGRGTGYMIMDAPASIHGKELNNIVRHAHTFIIPILPSPIDMRAAAEYIKEIRATNMISAKKGKICLLANRGRDNTNVFWQLDEFLDHLREPYVAALSDSMHYVRAAEKGLGIFEMAPAATAIVRAEWQPLIDWLGSKGSQP